MEMEVVKSYSEKLKDPRWQKKRLEILNRDNFKCVCCNDGESTLHIHHKKYIGSNPWDAPNDSLITVCEECHNDIDCWIGNTKSRNFDFHKIKFKNKTPYSFSVSKKSDYNAFLFQTYKDSKFTGGHHMSIGDINDLIAFLSDLK